MKKLLLITFLAIFITNYCNAREHKSMPYSNELNTHHLSEINYQKKIIQSFQKYQRLLNESISQEKKLKYADSMMLSARISGDKNLIAQSYLSKGLIFDSHYKIKAIDQYLTAYQYAKNSEDEHLKYNILYHIGAIKSYLKLYDEALEIFKDCKTYFEETSKYVNNNSSKSYYNILHQMIVCYEHQKKYVKADSLIHVGLTQTKNKPGFELEYSYFLKSKGISHYHSKKYSAAIKELQEALPVIASKKDFAWTAGIYYYLGRCYLQENREKEAIISFQKVDTIFKNNHFLLPELRRNYKQLIQYNKRQNDVKQELYYASQLLKIDSTLSKDFSYIPSKLHKEFDNIKESKGIEDIIFNIGLVSLCSLVPFGFYFTRRAIQTQSLSYENKFDFVKNSNSNSFTQIENQIEQEEIQEEKKYGISEEKVSDILNKLETFEAKKEFIQKGLTITTLSQQLNTNNKYLSHVINEHKGKSFSKYLAELRIEYITQMLCSNKKFLDYKIEALSEECGIASRQNFSDIFYEINGMRPTDFIKKIKENHVN